MEERFPASLEQLYSMLGFIRSFAQRIGFSNEVLSKIELACEEALVNVIDYAYPDQQGTITIRCVEPPQKQGIKIIIQDNGIHFNPLHQIKKGNPEKLGGYGVFLLTKIMDDVDYQRVDDTNVLTLVKYAS